MSCLPDWQEALRKQTYKEHVKEYGEDVATALSHCWGMVCISVHIYVWIILATYIYCITTIYLYVQQINGFLDVHIRMV